MPKTSLLMDPLDWHNVYVAPSTLGEQAGEGIFAKRDLPKGSIIVSYAGTISRNFVANVWEEYCNTVMSTIF